VHHVSVRDFFCVVLFFSLPAGTNSNREDQANYEVRIKRVSMIALCTILSMVLLFEKSACIFVTMWKIELIVNICGLHISSFQKKLHFYKNFLHFVEFFNQIFWWFSPLLLLIDNICILHYEKILLNCYRNVCVIEQNITLK